MWLGPIGGCQRASPPLACSETKCSRFMLCNVPSLSACFCFLPVPTMHVHRTSAFSVTQLDSCSLSLTVEGFQVVTECLRSSADFAYYSSVISYFFRFLSQHSGTRLSSVCSRGAKQSFLNSSGWERVTDGDKSSDTKCILEVQACLTL